MIFRISLKSFLQEEAGDASNEFVKIDVARNSFGLKTFFSIRNISTKLFNRIYVLPFVKKKTTPFQTGIHSISEIFVSEIKFHPGSRAVGSSL